MKIGIALSGGGIRGIAHSGVLKALEDYGIKADIIGGTSSGGLIASLYAMGYSPYYIYILFKKYAKDIVTINSSPIITGIGNYMINKKFEMVGLKTGETLEKTYNLLALKKGVKIIKDVKMPLVIPAVDISESKEYIFASRIPEKSEKK